MPTYDYDMIVIGGGAAGLTTAAGAAQLGVKVLLVEREPLLGGDCLHYGCVPSKTLIKSARVYHQCQHSEQFGLPAIEAPPVDFSKIVERIQKVKDVIQVHDSPERFQKLGAAVIFGAAAFRDDHVVEVTSSDGAVRRFSGKSIVLATGSAPSTPPIKGLDSVAYLTNMDVFTLNRLPESLVVLGGGPIAMEMAQSFQRLGCRVTVVQRSAQILSKEDKDMADVVMKNMQHDGVDFILGATTKEVRENNGKGIAVEVEADGRRLILEAEQLLVALGRSPNVEGLHLDAAGITHSGKGIPVDEKMRTNMQHIYAAGDVTGKYQFTHAAGYEGGIVVSNAVFKLPRKANYTWLPWATYTDPELASIGMNEKAARKAGIPYTVRTEAFSGNDRALAEGESEGRIKMLLGPKGNVLGVQIVGLHAGELINEWVAVLGGGVKLSALAGAVHPYPTLGEINKRVAGSLLGEKIFSPTVRKVLKLFFRYSGPGPR